ncbi:RimJ/RimL family protein N-acetyltransferase [Algibacter marinivivus]|uniref:RimJ/RimL family protein N-acetyltransferase n=1 Tax=Algibacter marinivivus TaxID=2100723 RepID=A0A2U2X8H4_9FLAO|nr:GNAT family N-acetyltransferase [Algibacter marinivivus]PWH84089.1 RimJ/RimL family protein N-acetyltransferase [Algibacter marinivivus]
MIAEAETERLLIEKFTLNDASFFKALVNTPHWIKYIGDRNTKTIEDAEERIKSGHLESYKTNGFGFYKLILKEKNIPIGTCGLIKRDELKHVDIGFAFLEDYERQGFGYEASIAIMELAKEKFNIKKLLAITAPYNIGSIKLLEKLSFRYEKRVKPFEDDEELLLFAKDL